MLSLHGKTTLTYSGRSLPWGGCRRSFAVAIRCPQPSADIDDRPAATGKRNRRFAAHRNFPSMINIAQTDAATFDRLYSR
jgi:hypothetical protein